MAGSVFSQTNAIGGTRVGRQWAQQQERGLLIGLDFRENDPVWQPADSLAELEQLALTADIYVAGSVMLPIRRLNPATLIGSGQAHRIARSAGELQCHTVIFDDNLLPRQQRNLEKILGVKVVDRTMLILDIFASHARTAEGKLQVERAQIDYVLPRLSDLWVEFSRTGGGIGTRGPGETQIETDRQELRSRLAKLDVRLNKVRQRRAQARAARQRKGLPLIGLVGYTNSGKSSLMRALTGANTLIQDKLFATLDPLTRQLDLPDGRHALLTDTVGFIQRLPSRLVAAFRATLEELETADLLLHVVDAASPSRDEQIDAVVETLEELRITETSTITIFNKVDKASNPDMPSFPGAIWTSATKGIGLDLLQSAISKHLRIGDVRLTVRVPFHEGRLINIFHREGIIDNTEYTEDGTIVTGALPAKIVPIFKAYEVQD